MPVCVYDNPATWRREAWQDGEELCSYSASILAPFARAAIPADMFFFGANIGPWKDGQVVGDKGAMTQPPTGR